MSGETANPPQPPAPNTERSQLFISTSHRDGAWVERLRTMLLPLERRYGLERCDASRIQAGGVWREEIEQALARAQIHHQRTAGPPPPAA